MTYEQALREIGQSLDHLAARVRRHDATLTSAEPSEPEIERPEHFCNDPIVCNVCEPVEPDVSAEQRETDEKRLDYVQRELCAVDHRLAELNIEERALRERLA